jgi:hypothetical protein
MNQHTLWGGAVQRFWEDVQKLLEREHHHDPARARAGIKSYQQMIDQHGFADAVYNQGEERTAEVIDAGIRDGFPPPL